MDIYSKKILDFLKLNSNLDLEVADIAFHLKLDEQFVQNHMSALLRQEQVINRRNEYGRIYWYAAPPQNLDAEIPVMELPDTPPNLPPAINSNSQREELDDVFEKEVKKIPLLKMLFVIILVAAFGALGYLLITSMDKKLENVIEITNSISKQSVQNIDYLRYVDETTVQIRNLESEVKGLTAMVDSLKAVLKESQAEKKELIEKSRKVVGKRK